MNSITGTTGRPALDNVIRKTLTNTFIAVAGMWVVTAVSGALSKDLHLGIAAVLGLFVASLAVIFMATKFRDSAVGLGLLGVFGALQGVTLGPLVNHYLHMRGGAEIVAMSAGLTGLATLACAAYCISTRRSFSRIAGFLFAGLIVLVLASLVALFIPVPALHLAISVIATLLFVGYLLYDIGEVVTGVETNYISAALGVYLDMLNIFVNLLRIIGFLSSDD